MILKVHDGLTAATPETTDAETKPKTTLVTKMADLGTAYAQAGSYIVLDADLACEPVMTRFRRHQVHWISRVRSSTVAHAPFSAVPTVKGPGRPR